MVLGGSLDLDGGRMLTALENGVKGAKWFSLIKEGYTHVMDADFLSYFDIIPRSLVFGINGWFLHERFAL